MIVPACIQRGLIAAACCVSLNVVAPAAQALPPTLDEAIVELSGAAYPILKKQTATTFPKFTEDIGNLVLGIPAEKLGKSLDLGIDTFLSVPPEKVAALETAVKESFAGLDPASCDLVPLPPPSLVSKFESSKAVEQLDATKLKAFSDEWGGSLKALARTETAICLPPAEKLDRLALAQAEVGRSFGAEESKKFGVFTTAMLKSQLTLGKILPIAQEAKTLAPSATPAEKARFQKAGKTIENAAAAEAARARMEARGASTGGAVARPSAPTAEEVQAQTAARKAAAEAKAAEAEAKKAELKAQQEAFYADLRAKAEAKKAAAAAAK